MKRVTLIILVLLLSCSCRTTSKFDEVNWNTMIEKAELAVDMAHEVYALWDLTHQLLNTPESELTSKREAFKFQISEAESHLEYVKDLAKQ